MARRASEVPVALAQTSDVAPTECLKPVGKLLVAMALMLFFRPGGTHNAARCGEFVDSYWSQPDRTQLTIHTWIPSDLVSPAAAVVAMESMWLGSHCFFRAAVMCTGRRFHKLTPRLGVFSSDAGLC